MAQVAEDPRSTADDRGELFGVHIPELQLADDEYRAAFKAAGLTQGERYLELGSGHGRGLIIAAAEFGAVAVGVEYLEDAIERTRRAAADAGVSERVQLVRDDLRRIAPQAANVVHMHLGPAFHELLAPRLERLLDSSTRVIAAGWKVAGWKPLQAALEAWDGGYVYCPADPTLHTTWQGDVRFLDAPGHRPGLGLALGSRVVLQLEAHAQLTQLELRLGGPGARSVRPALSTYEVERGQHLLVELERGMAPGGSADEPLDVTIQLWGRSREGRITARGETLLVRAESLS
jgi:SAM-dependent methyltransferase